MKRKGIRRVNPERKKRLLKKQFGHKAEWIRVQRCDVCGKRPCDPHHVRSRGAGGTSKDLVPLCRSCHNELHQMGRKTFEERFKIDLKDSAERWEERWQRRSNAERADTAW